MRLHELRILAIGPFVEEQVIDFERLGASGLFLLEGPTGVGKTTVLDAVTFALYGSVTGSTSDGRLRSDFAATGTPPRVQLELSVRGTRLRLTRTPEYLRPKQRGTGMLKERPTAHLEVWQDGAWVSRSARQDEIGEFVGEQLGLTREQFRQVVLLPQGEFAGFLRADDDGRRAVLVKLFGTQFFERLAGVLQRRASRARAQVTQAESDLRALVSVAWDASGKRPEEDAERPLTWDQQLADLESVREIVAARSRSAARESQDAHDVEVAARAVSTEAHEVVTLVAERDALIVELQCLEGQRHQQEERRGLAARARRGIPVRPLLGLLDEARSHVGQTLDRVAHLGLGADAEQAAERARDLAEEAGSAERTVAGLGHVVTLESGTEGMQARLAEAQTTQAQTQARGAELAERAALLPARLEEVGAAVAAAQATADAAERAERELAAARRRRDAAADVVAIDERLGALRVAERDTRRAHDEARDHVALVVDQRLAGLQGVLAARLVVGEACLVCGSLEHPAPAATDHGQVGEDVLRGAEQVRDHAWAAWEAASGSVATAEAARAAAAAVADGVTTQDAEAHVAELCARVAAGEPAAAEVARLGRRDADLRSELGHVQEELVRSAASEATARAEVARILADVEAAEAQVARQRDGHATVAARCAALEARAVAARAGAEALVEHQRAREAELAAQAGALAGAQAAGFVDLDDARDGVLAELELTALEEQVRAWEAGLMSIGARLAAEHLQSVEGLSAADVTRVADAAEAILAEATERARAAASRAARAAQSAELFEQRVSVVRGAVGEWATISAAATEVMAVDDYVRGLAGNPRMTLSTFVLRYWFEQVVAAANVRLHVMSNGKYELLRVERGARAASRVGLGLAVLDRHTGCERGTETLSGGETFYTSLALALGLADVVVAEAGGAQLDTLFIDEGFGSLDTTTLDEVMTVIDELRGHGRVVGVVSHVAELNERIPERLSIRRERPDGPSKVSVVA